MLSTTVLEETLYDVFIMIIKMWWLDLLNMVIKCDKKNMLEKLLLSKKELSDINFERLKNSSNDSMYLTVNSLIDINNIITDSNNNILRRFNVRSCGYDKIYMDEQLKQFETVWLI